MLLSVSLTLIAPPARAAGPYDLERSNEYGWLGAGLTLSVGGAIAIHKTEPYSAAEIAALDAADINGFDRRLMRPYRDDHVGDALLASSLAWPISLMARSDVQDDADEVALMWLEAAALNQGLLMVTKAVTQRPRPLAYDPDASSAIKNGKNARLSFYSGHTAWSAMNSFFTATVFSDYSSDRDAEIAVWSGAVIYSVVTGLCRVNTGHHFATDVITGLVVGATVGYLVPALHRTDDADSGSPPAPSSASNTLRIGAAFSF